MTKDRILSAQEILTAKDLPVEKLSIPEWGGFVYVRPMTGAERDQMEGAIQAAPDDEKFNNLRALTASMCLVDSTGTRMFSMKDVADLGSKSASALDRIFAKVQEINKLTSKDVEELMGNSSTIQSEDSNSD